MKQINGRTMMESKKKPFIERYIIAIYFIITLVATFALVAAYLFSENEFVSPQYAPTIGLVLICVMSKDWSVWKKINWNVLNNLLWVFIALFLPVAVIMISSLIMSFMGTQFVAWHDTTIGYSIAIFISILGCVFEEIGWRGYLLPKFAEKHSMFYSAIGVGLLWGVWHVKFAYGILGFILFVALMVCFSILMTWLYIKTKGNLLCMIVFHFGVNIGSVMLLQNREGVLFYSLSIIICALICVPIVMRNRKLFFK